jgi:hypothetical protein
MKEIYIEETVNLRTLTVNNTLCSAQKKLGKQDSGAEIFKITEIPDDIDTHQVIRLFSMTTYWPSSRKPFEIAYSDLGEGKIIRV